MAAVVLFIALLFILCLRACVCVSRAGVRRSGAQLGTISVGPGSQSTCTKVCRNGRGVQLGVTGPVCVCWGGGGKGCRHKTHT